jgi:hypothetical protein
MRMLISSIDQPIDEFIAEWVIRKWVLVVGSRSVEYVFENYTLSLSLSSLTPLCFLAAKT